MRDMMSDTKVYVTDEQPWVAVGGDSTTQTTPKCTQVGTKMFTWSTTPMSRTRQESRNIERERGDKERRGKDNKGRGGEMKRNKEGEKKRRAGKTEEERKWKCVRSENQKWKKKDEETDFLYWKRGKNSNTSKQKHSTKEENYTMSTRWWLSGGWVENALVWRMN